MVQNWTREANEEEDLININYVMALFISFTVHMVSPHIMQKCVHCPSSEFYFLSSSYFHCKNPIRRKSCVGLLPY
jgi:hypothetical protein